MIFLLPRLAWDHCSWLIRAEVAIPGMEKVIHLPHSQGLVNMMKREISLNTSAARSFRTGPFLVTNQNSFLPGVGYSKLTPPANTGLGFIDAVSDEEILSWADPEDVNGDGISGVPNWIGMKEYLYERPGYVEVNGKYIGRFGKKAAAYDLHQQTAQAYNEDIGISSSYEVYDTHSGLETDPEISDQTVQDVVFYLKTLKAPIPRNKNDDSILAGKKIFNDVGCAACHRPEMKTGPSPIAAIANKTFYPYSDLLLHDMGAGLDDGYTEGSAKTSEWRTPPLWGLGLSKNSQGGEYFLLHDGRANSIEEAILLHGGEGNFSRENFESLTDSDKSNLIKFLESL